MIYERIIEALNRKEVRYLVVGGVAMVLYGYGRLTTIEDLIEMKRKSNRNQDILDIKWLEQSKE